MKKIAFVVMACMLVSALTGCKKVQKTDNSLENLKARNVFVLGLDDSFPPMGFRNEDNEIVGFDIDLAKEVAARLGVEFKAQPIDWDAKELELSTGKIDCIWNGLTITPERLEALAFTKPYLNNDQVLVVRKDSGIKSFSDAAGKVAGVQNGSSAQDALEHNPAFKASLKNIVPFKDNLTAMNDLETRGVDMVIMDSIVAAYDITQSGKDLVIVDDVLAKEAYGIAFRKNDLKLRDAVQSVLEEMAADGTAEAISKKWFGADITVIGK
ncbi:MAG: amino acid ABC transporter substrate-binding protein [Treponema sp.]|jgi:polar amino acid transport system substrate-binding protein|nr:amino acid ABC transporter substrate-binding protein [Treponema sp.]